jgi:chromosome segregation protein
MALFRTKPSPFCLLDEVDAPLDDVNTSRFLEIIRAMSVDTQFLVVTHNKLTMESASRLYGVTMAERGVSKVVAVDLEEVQPAGDVAASA